MTLDLFRIYEKQTAVAPASEFGGGGKEGKRKF